MSSNLFAIVSFATAKLKMKTLPTGFPVALCSTAIHFSDRQSNRSFLLLRIADLVVHAVDVLDVSVSEVVAFPPGEHPAFSGTVLMHRQILVAAEEVLGPISICEGDSDVVGVVTPLGGVALVVLHGVQVVEVGVRLRVHQDRGVEEDGEGQVEVEREEGEVKERRSWMACGWNEDSRTS